MLSILVFAALLEGVSSPHGVALDALFADHRPADSGEPYLKVQATADLNGDDILDRVVVFAYKMGPNRYRRHTEYLTLVTSSPTGFAASWPVVVGARGFRLIDEIDVWGSHITLRGDFGVTDEIGNMASLPARGEVYYTYRDGELREQGGTWARKRSDAEQAARWEAADKETFRLSPDNFPDLPAVVRADLKTRGCTIPQVYCCNDKPHNVIKGHFKLSTQLDWAVLCSVDRTSTILVYGNGSAADVTALRPLADKGWLQGIENQRIGYSRIISTVDAKYIKDHALAYGTWMPDVLDHEGIDEGFMEKASNVWYLMDGEWLRLQGAD